MLAKLQIERRLAEVGGDRRPEVVQLHERHDQRRALRIAARGVEHDQETAREGLRGCGLLRLLRHEAPHLLGPLAAIVLEHDRPRTLAEHTVHLRPARALILFTRVGEPRRDGNRRRDLPDLLRRLDLDPVFQRRHVRIQEEARVRRAVRRVTRALPFDDDIGAVGRGGDGRHDQLRAAGARLGALALGAGTPRAETDRWNKDQRRGQLGSTFCVCRRQCGRIVRRPSSLRETPITSEYRRYVSMDATTTFISSPMRSIPARDSRAQPSMTMPLSRTRSRTSIIVPPSPGACRTATSGDGGAELPAPPCLECAQVVCRRYSGYRIGGSVTESPGSTDRESYRSAGRMADA